MQGKKKKQTQTIKPLLRFRFKVVISQPVLRATTYMSVRHRDKTSVSSGPWQPCTHRASSTLGTSYERVFGLNVQLSNATWCALKRKMELFEDNFLPSVPVNRCVQSAALQPSEKAKELVGMPDEEGTS